MKNRNRNFIISLVLIFLAIAFTIMVKLIDVKSIGANNTNIGFATLNELFFKSIGVNIVWYYITDWLGIIPILMTFVYAIIGLVQMIKRKRLFKVDKEILLLGLFYIILIALYLFFEKVVVNYRPILMNGFLEASFPSSHTLMAVCICGSSIMINNKLYKNRMSKIVNILFYIIIIVTILGRLISGVHWLTDILGGVIISLALLMTFYSVIHNIDDNKNN